MPTPHADDRSPDEQPAIPATAPLQGPSGSLLYTGSDGRQYIVCGDPGAEGEEELLEAFHALRSGAAQLEELVAAARHWVEAAGARGLSPRAARRTLLWRLRQALSDAEADGS